MFTFVCNDCGTQFDDPRAARTCPRCGGDDIDAIDIDTTADDPDDRGPPSPSGHALKEKTHRKRRPGPRNG